MDKITLVCTSLGHDKELLNKMLNSAAQFDEIFLNVDQEKLEEKDKAFCCTKQIYRVFNDKHWSIPEAYNWMIDKVQTEWVCSFPDDDYFYGYGLREMITEVHKGIDSDVAHFKFRISGHRPPQDIRGLFLGKEYDLCEKQPITSRLLEKHNRLPAGSFFRKSAWEKAGGFQGNKMHDWDLWKRMAKSGCRFKYFDHLVYNMVRRENSAWVRQNKK